MVTVNTLQQLISSGSQTYPVYIGFMNAADILSISGVPAFGNATPHDLIATNVLTPPIREWQRPLDNERVDIISGLFNNLGEMMPNPVLLGENVAGIKPPITIAPRLAAGGIPTGTFDVTFLPPSGNQEAALWILDGQHRINGLALSAQRQNFVPVVFLLNAGGNFYNGPLLAKLFAQVTTSAQKLDDLHNEWLTFAFRLGQYAPHAPQSVAQASSMQCVAEICRSPVVGGQTNPFFSNVRFNVHQHASPSPGGFEYTCTDLKNLVFSHYYNQPVPGGHLPPPIVAQQLVLAHRALVSSVSNHSHSVFFGTGNHGQKIMQDAFVAGVLTFLREHGIPPDWMVELSMLAFPTTNWDFSWVNSLHGEEGTISKNLAVAVLTRSFKDRALPVRGSPNIADILRGNNAEITLEYSKVNAASHALSGGRVQVTLQRGNVTSSAIAPAMHVKAKIATLNIGKLKITDKNSPPGRAVEYSAMKRGMLLDPASHSNPLSLLIEMRHYGGNVSIAEIDISW